MNLRRASTLYSLDHWATATPDRPFIQWKNDAAQTYGEFHLATRRLAGGLQSLGVVAGDTVLVMLPNSLEIVHTWFACNATRRHRGPDQHLHAWCIPPARPP